MRSKTLEMLSKDLTAQQAALRSVLVNAFHLVVFKGERIPGIPGSILPITSWVPCLNGHDVSVTVCMAPWSGFSAYGVLIHQGTTVFFKGRIKQDLNSFRIDTFTPGEWQTVIANCASQFSNDDLLIRLSQ